MKRVDESGNVPSLLVLPGFQAGINQELTGIITEKEQKRGHKTGRKRDTLRRGFNLNLPKKGSQTRIILSLRTGRTGSTLRLITYCFTQRTGSRKTSLRFIMNINHREQKGLFAPHSSIKQGAERPLCASFPTVNGSRKTSLRLILSY